MSLGNFSNLLVHFLICSPQTRTLNTKFQNQGTSPCICKKGSFTVEAAIIIPLTVGFLGCILFLFRVMQVQAAIDEAVIYAGRKVAVESSAIPSETALFLSTQGFMMAMLKDYPEVENYVENGFLGINLLESEFSGSQIQIKAKYKMILPVSFFGIDSIALYSQNSFQKWVGDSYKDSEDQWVYITPTGVVYHANTGCRAIDLSIKEVERSQIAQMRGENGQKYYPCSQCNDKTQSSVVYCTDYGTLFHAKEDCSSLKRTIRKVCLKDVGDRIPCSFCY